MKVINKICKTTREYNEDFVFANEKYAFVLDGATELKPNKISNTSDACWYVNKFATYLENYLETNNICESLKKSLRDINSDIDKFSNNINTNLDIPSACVAVVKENSDNYELYVLGDCSIIYGNKEKQQLLTNTYIRELDKKQIKKMVKIAKEKNIDVIDAYKIILSDLKVQRSLKNKPNGYYVLDVYEDAVNHGTYIVIPKEGIDMILLLSDGFSSYYECLGLEKDYKSFFLKNYETSIDKLYEELRKRESEDKKLNKYPRYKASDDASIIKLVK